MVCRCNGQSFNIMVKGTTIHTGSSKFALTVTSGNFHGVRNCTTDICDQADRCLRLHFQRVATDLLCLLWLADTLSTVSTDLQLQQHDPDVLGAILLLWAEQRHSKNIRRGPQICHCRTSGQLGFPWISVLGKH